MTRNKGHCYGCIVLLLWQRRGLELIVSLCDRPISCFGPLSRHCVNNETKEEVVKLWLIVQKLQLLSPSLDNPYHRPEQRSELLGSRNPSRTAKQIVVSGPLCRPEEIALVKLRLEVHLLVPRVVSPQDLKLLWHVYCREMRAAAKASAACAQFQSNKYLQESASVFI